MPPLRHYPVVPGAFGDELTPQADELYMSTTDVETLYCMTVSEAQIRAAQTLINTTCNRPTLWPHSYTEQLSLPSDRQQVQLNVRPVLKVLAADGRYGYGRRDRRVMNTVNYDYLAAIAVWGSPPGWQALDVEAIDVYGPSGDCWLPTGHFLVTYSEVRMTYLAGFTQIPDRVKLALVEIMNVMSSRGVSNRRMSGIGKIQSVYSSEGFVTQTAKDLLEPFITRSLF